MKKDDDLKALEKACAALKKSTSHKMLRANIEFIVDSFLCNPPKDLPAHLLPEWMQKEREQTPPAAAGDERRRLP